MRSDLLPLQIPIIPSSNSYGSYGILDKLLSYPIPGFRICRISINGFSRKNAGIITNSVGYYIKKYMDESTVGQYFNNENAWLEFRYAEILLDFAEAAIELGDIQEGLDALNKVRNRAGLPDRVTADQAQAREWLRHERQIEFFGEGDRWYTIRKWMIADDVIKDVHSMKITHLPDGGTRWFYDKSTTVDERAWDDRQYWLPVSRDEINKAPQLTQNPGY